MLISGWSRVVVAGIIAGVMLAFVPAAVRAGTSPAPTLPSYSSVWRVSLPAVFHNHRASKSVEDGGYGVELARFGPGGWVKTWVGLLIAPNPPYTEGLPNTVISQLPGLGGGTPPLPPNSKLELAGPGGHKTPPLQILQTGAVSQPANPVPVLAYYYIWFDSTSWQRAKTDYPQLGRYSSDDRTVMRQHIQWAKQAGIQGFIVSWKSTDVLNRRLDQLATLAEDENFKLAVIYQGLDFNRNPLPADRVAADLDYFTQHFTGRKAFQLFSKPLVIWSGTWKFSVDDISRTVQGRREKLLILASERNLDGYRRLAGLVDGDAYYWSSVNPETFDGYQAKLEGMSEAVHQQGGLWIAPAAPGFDARLIGGTSVVERKDGETLRTQINTALQSSPDAVGIISWNEFSENSYIEPSEKYGTRYLQILAGINHLPAPSLAEIDSSEPARNYPLWFPGQRTAALGGLAVLILAGFIAVAVRRKG
jgi:hypothetical protein